LSEVCGYRNEKDELFPDNWSALGVAKYLMVVIGVNSSRISVGGEGRNKLRSAPWFARGLESSREMPRGKDIDEINPLASIASAQVKDSWRRRTREIISVGGIRTGTPANGQSNTMTSRSGFERKNPINLPKGNGVVYPTSFSSTSDVMLNTAG